MGFSPLGLFRIFLLGMLASSLLGAAMVPNPLSASTPPPSRAEPRTIPFTDVNPLGANFFLDREVELWKKEQTLKMARDAGIGWAKILFSWEGLEPKKGRYWDDKLRKSTWDKYDELVSLAEKYGLRLIARLDRTPDWARQDKTYKTTPPDNFEDYGQFVYEVVKRYKGKIHYYQIWNEPNIWPEWGNRPVDPQGYVALSRLAYRRAKEADPNVVILSAPLAQTLEETPRNRSELTYLDQLYRAGAKDSFDILFANAYGFEYPPEAPPDPKVLNFRRLELLREVMVRHGDANKPIWINEFGWNASPADFPKEKLFWRRVSEEEQARYTINAIRMAREWGWVGVINLWYFRQVGDLSPKENSDYYFRVVDVDFTPRLLYTALQDLSKTLAVASPGVSQELAAPIKAAGNWGQVLRPEALGGTALQSSEPGDRLRFTFSGSAVTLVHSRGPAQEQLVVTVDGQPANRLPKNDKGQSVLNLHAPQEEWQIPTLLASGLAPGRHVLELVVAPSPAAPGERALALVDAFDVAEAQPSFNQFYLFLGVVLLSALTLGASFALRVKR